MWIKICGVTSVADAEMVAEAGADAVGLNFYPPSKRFVGSRNADDPGGVQTARRIRDAVADRLEVVGVFVNASAEQVADIASAVKLDTVQFHGDEAPEIIADLHQRCPYVRIIRAFRIGESGTADMQTQLQQIKQLNIPLAAVLVDAFVSGEYGGTGHIVNADVINEWRSEFPDAPPLILAGGLTPESVVAAVAAAQPWGVDTASGVESSPGIKSTSKTNTFCQLGRDAPAGDSRG